MNIRKLGHCCLIIETNEKRIMTDPGTFSTLQNEERNVDIILFTHEHSDHFHLESLKIVLENNPQAKIITNSAVGRLLNAEKIPYEILEHGGLKNEQGVMLEGFGEKHAEIYKEIGQVENTGYFIENKFFYPGDALTDPGKPVEILALPITGPWMKIKDAIEWAAALKARIAFPVHDGSLKSPNFAHGVAQKALAQNGIEFVSMIEGDSHDF